MLRRCIALARLMSQPPCLTGFLAFNEEDARKINEIKRIAPEDFQVWAKYGPLADPGWIPLRKDVDTAIESALRGNTQQALRAAYDFTDWHMVELNITQEKVFSLFMENQVSQAPDGKGFRVYCPIILGADASLTWHHCTLEPRGYDRLRQVGRDRFLGMLPRGNVQQRAVRAQGVGLALAAQRSFLLAVLAPL